MTHAKIRQWLGLITSFTQSIALTKAMCIKIMGADSIKYLHACNFCHAFIGCDFLLLTPFTYFSFPRILIVTVAFVIQWYLKPKMVPFLANSLCSMLHRNDEKIAKYKKLLNIFCIVYEFILSNKIHISSL